MLNCLKDKRKKRIVITTISIILVFAVIVVACGIYLSDYYKADERAIEAFASINQVSFHTLENGTIVFEPENATHGFIFYPGGKVENNAYKPLMAALAEKGVFCVLVEMPFNLAVFDIDAADGIIEEYPQIENWYIGGHSLGGSMAASYLADNISDFRGIVLLGSYSTADLSGSKLKALSIYGSEDKIMNREKYNDNKSNLPKPLKEMVIQGGNHAYFGMYGLQEGDGTPEITNEEQIQITASAIFDWMNK